MGKRQRPGQSLELLVTTIERILSRDSDAIVEYSKRLPDKDTGELRQHDIVITFQKSRKHHTSLIALECKDRSRPVGVPDLEAFAKKCEKTGIHKGIIVSSKGFYKTARKKAESLNIVCMTLEEAIGFDWCLASGIHQEFPVIDHISFNLVPTEPCDGIKNIFDVNGNLVTKEDIRQFAINCFNHFSKSPGWNEYSRVIIKVEDPGYYFLDTNNKKHIPKEIHIDISYRIETKAIPLHFYKYTDKSQTTYNLASADLEIHNSDYKLMIMEEQDGSKMVYLVKNK